MRRWSWFQTFCLFVGIKLSDYSLFGYDKCQVESRQVSVISCQLSDRVFCEAKCIPARPSGGENCFAVWFHGGWGVFFATHFSCFFLLIDFVPAVAETFFYSQKLIFIGIHEPPYSRFLSGTKKKKKIKKPNQVRFTRFLHSAFCIQYSAFTHKCEGRKRIAVNCQLSVKSIYPSC